MSDLSEQEKKDFFVSYTGSDKAWAEWIAYVLESAGYRVILQSWDFLAGGNFVLDMHEATKASVRTIAVLSRAYCDAGFTQPEWTEAFSTDPEGKQGLLIPVRIEDFKPEGFFRSINYIDLVGRDEQESERALLEEVEARIKEERRKPDKMPPFPGGEEDAPHFPGALPPTWNLPLRLRNFTGREDLLASIGEIVTNDRTCVLSGLGGVGKSRLALEYAYRHLGDYDLVWRIRAHEDATARADLADLATALQISDPERPRGERIEALQNALAGCDRWLLIFDDAVAGRALLPLLPPGSSGHVLVTSRTATGWLPLGKGLEIGPFQETEAVAYLRDRLGAGNESDLRQVCEMLGNLPLAVEQAGGYMEATGIEPDRYAERLAERNPELLRRPQPLDYEHTISTTWQLSMEQIKEHEEAGRLLSLCAYLGPDLIPRGLFDNSDSAFTVTPILSPAAVDAGLEELRRFSLIAISAGRISIHPLVQWVVQEAQSPEQQVEQAQVLLGLLAEAWPADSGTDPASWPACGVLAPHLQSFARVAQDQGQNSVVAELLERVGFYLRCRGDFMAAVDVYEEALETLEGMGGIPLMKVLRDYGVALTYLDRDEEAVNAQTRALEELRKCAVSPEEAGDTYQLAGITFCEAGEHQRAREAIERGIALFEEEPEPNLHKIGSAVGNLGNVIRLLGDTDGARKLLVRSQETIEDLHGPVHQDVAIGLGALARVDMELEDFGSARTNLERAGGIFEAIYGPISYELGRVYHDLAAVDFEEGNLPEAKAAYVRALENYRGSVGSEHPVIRDTLLAYAHVCMEMGDQPSAEQAIVEAGFDQLNPG
jgi:tetratricopeptide (TPR) repeat protein